VQKQHAIKTLGRILLATTSVVAGYILPVAASDCAAHGVPVTVYKERTRKRPSGVVSIPSDQLIRVTELRRLMGFAAAEGVIDDATLADYLSTLP